MVQTIQAEQLQLHDLKSKFGLEYRDSPDLFSEWRDNLPELKEQEKANLDEVKLEFRHLLEYGMAETIVKMVIISPLLKMAGFFLPPFNITAEKTVEISEQDDLSIRGRLDLLVFQPEFWILVVETKGLAYSIEKGLPQLLGYMLGSPNHHKPVFGLISNGANFKFLKLIREDHPIYCESISFSLDRGDDLELVLRILKKIAKIV
ncbi:restriction endonuclease subunit R [Crocosphaera sp.]|uniref:restriction endonuclease subunit R n=1 Tax=Crocosphaera sp. TaxID=2729996 RepID=UPI00261454D3|nr:restriction endonuclease subunit R [Crocosphaera sp.]MDJ0582675.1 restriction endonuclease subunit R [Crocosphaera sp.]